MAGRIFTFDPSEHSERFRRQSYICIHHGVSEGFLNFATEQLNAHLRSGDNISGRFDKRGMKRQFLFAFPDDEAAILDAADRLAALTGLPRERMTLSERHYKVYNDDAPARPVPHKDRCSSQISVGVPLVPEASRLAVFPDHDRTENPFDSYDELLRSLPPERRPENLLRDVAPVEAPTRRGDVFVFWGANMFHERINPAGTRILYLKWNALGLDPIGEDLACLRRAREEALAANV